ncbi:unnamed protein product [Brassica rapa subsp. trilocularis]
MLLANCSTNLFGTVLKECIYPLDHCKADPIKVDMRSLHIMASLSSFWIATVIICCLYWATWLSRSLVPSYILMLGKRTSWHLY